MTIWKSCLKIPFEFAASSSMLTLSSCCCLSTLSFLLPQPSVLNIGCYLCLLLISFSLTVVKVLLIRHLFLFLLQLDVSNRFSGHFQQDCLGIFPEICATSSCAASKAVNMFGNSAENRIAFVPLSSQRFTSGMLCCHCLFASLTFRGLLGDQILGISLYTICNG